MWNFTKKFSFKNLTLCQPWRLPPNFFGDADSDISSNYSNDTPSAPPIFGQQPMELLPDFFYDCDDLINCKSNKPTRHIVLHTINVTTTTFKKLFMMELEILGDINNIVSFSSSDTIVISYYRMKHAEQAVNYINRKYYSLFQAHYAKPDLFKKPFEQELLQQLSGVGSIYSISITSISHTQKFITIEYDDYRDTRALYECFNRLIINLVDNGNGVKIWGSMICASFIVSRSRLQVVLCTNLIQAFRREIPASLRRSINSNVIQNLAIMSLIRLSF
ncbi:hypothetical protein BD770DRAFT_414549 [Pilaira anomala]|nr:hypothetical protein BD770DRAFT_414549 [Pilaira anomala]